LAVLFGLGVWHFEGQRKAVEFYTGYLIELSLSADNVFVFVLIFTYFAVPQKYQHKVLFWGVLGALVMRVLMIAVGASLIQKFGWLLYPFGAFLIFTGIKMVFSKGKQLHPEQNPLVRWFTRRVPVTADYREDRFFVRVDGKRSATPLFVVLLCVEVSDLVFAVDSIPAIFAVTLDPFIVYTSNVFAIMGLRSLYFVLAKIVDKFYYLRTGLGVVLGFVGIKMLLAHTDHEIDTPVALCVVGSVLSLALVASLLRARFRAQPAPPSPK
jgi:tellurite resistance protein TerC